MFKSNEAIKAIMSKILTPNPLINSFEAEYKTSILI